MDTSYIDSLLEPIGLDGFKKEYMGDDKLYLEGDSHKFRSLVTWDDINKILEYHDLSFPQIRLARAGDTVNPDNYIDKIEGGTKNVSSIDISCLYNEIRQDATLIIDAVDDLNHNLKKLSNSLAWALRDPVQVNAYISCDPIEGFDAHWDDHDVLIFQLEGPKEWEIYGQSREYPLRSDVGKSEQPPSETEWKGVVTPGDLLYIPRGWWHMARGTGVPTLHLTVGIKRATGVDLLRWMVDKMKSEPEFRKDLPRFASEEKKGRHIQKLKEIVLSFWDDKDRLMEEYFSDRDGRAKPALSFDLPYIMNDDVSSSFDSISVKTTSTCPVDVNSDGGNVYVRCNEKVYEFLLDAEPILKNILDGNKHEVDDIYNKSPESVTRNQVDELISRLILEGLITTC